MKRSLAAIAVLAMCSVPVVGYAQTTGYPPAGTSPVAPPQHGDRHPEMRKALKHLEAAKESLQHAAHDYSGHRDQAIALIEQAEEQIHQGLEAEEHK